MTDPEDDRALAAEYVLGLLDVTERVEAERRTLIDPAFARSVEDWRERFAVFDDTAETQVAGDALWRRIEHAVAAAEAPPASAAATGPSRWRDGIAFWRTAALGASFAALLLAIGLGFAIREARLQPQLVAVLLDGNRAGAVVHVFDDGRVVLVPLTSIAVPAGRALQVWTLPSRERGPVSVGLMDHAQTLKLRLRDLPPPGPDQLFEITLEPETGSPTGRPTGPILFVGRAARTL